MQAMQVLSFLRSQKSLITIFEGLDEPDKYVKLTAARCLARRKSICYLPEITQTMSETFPEDHKLLADILHRFGKDMAPRLERIVSSSDNPVIQAGALEALILMMPPSISLDLDALMENPDKRVRAATVALSTVVQHHLNSKVLLTGLQDEATMVRIRALKLAAVEKRQDAIEYLYESLDDPLMWVRYWAARAILNSGRTGKNLASSLSLKDSTAGLMAREVISEVL